MEKDPLSNLLLFQNYHIKKFLNIMRISTFLLFLCVFTSFATTSNSQNAKVNISGNSLTVGNFIDQVEKQTDYLFVYSKNEVNINEAVAVKSGDKSVSECLTEAFKNSDVKYAFENDYIVLTKNATPSLPQTGKKINGVVKDSKGEAVIGANVVVKGTTNGTITDIDGKYSLDVPAGAVLQVSYIGYLTKEIPVGSQPVINVELLEDSQALDEVVVVGYGTMRKSDVTGSISVTKGEDMIKAQSFSALDNLRGKASGVNIFSNSGQPGGSSRVIIRGIGTINSSSDPLYVVDGVVMEDFKLLNPNDIERIEVLKDASAAAIYGARGANGVILVSTKRGNKGEGTSISYSGSVSMSNAASYMETLNAQQWTDAFMQGLENENKWMGYDWSLNRTDWFNDSKFFDAQGNPLYNTNWQKEATRTAVSHNHQLSIQQGGKNSSVGAFLNYTDQQGIVNNTFMKRLNMKLAYDANPTPWLSTAINLLVNHTWQRYTPEEGGGQDARRTMIEMMPWMPVTMPDGSYTTSTSSTLSGDLGFEGMSNPVMILEQQKRMNYRTQIFGNAAFTFHLAKDLDLKTQIGVDNHNNTYRGYSSIGLNNISMPNGWAEINHTNTLYWQEETYLTHNLTSGKHRLNTMAGLSWQERVYNYDRSRTEGFSDDFYEWNNMGVGTTPNSPSSDWNRWAMNSYFLRGAYSYDDKYMATVTARMDGSSKFGENNKYAFFPSLGLGWNMSQEGFMKDIEAINLLKLHSSYGMTGNSEIGTYSSLAMVNSGTDILNDNRAATAHVSSLANPDLKWEKTGQFDFGVNLNMFSNRLNFDVSYYYKKTTDLLLERPVPHSTGFSSVMDNIGSVQNKGLDIMINTVNLQGKDFSWASTLNVNYNKNKILELGENNEDIEPGPWWVSGSQTILRVGQSLGSFYGYERLGVWTEDERAEAEAAGSAVGRAKRSADKKILGKGTPDFSGSFINEFNYKNWDLTVDLQFVAGVEVMQQYCHSTYDRFGITSGLSKILTDAYDGTNPNTMQQAIYLCNSGHAGQDTQLDSQWVCDGSYLRGNLIQLGYTFNPQQCKSIGLGSMRIYASVNNAFVINSSDFFGFDPEGTSQGSNQWGQNMYFFQYPKPRTYTVGLNVTF